ncbi:unnamed protein product [Acanthoscelides obtectus]|nr:unnamed protein product [Acanthoscelides obtectus]CAK1625188.1 Leucine-rich melanocyte differentiation-associated protein [Acanthoscelides obtectus]
MTSLGTLLLAEQSTNFAYDYTKSTELADDDACLQRLSLAYERLHIMPRILLEGLANHVRILDISHNEFDNLDFLSELKVLTSLICDHNNITSDTTIPYLPKLELLWMNHCKISELYPWAKRLSLSCPNLKYLSLMGNAITPTYLNCANIYEKIHYRLFMVSLFRKLVHLDDRAVSNHERNQAQKLYPRSLMERLVTKSQQTMPECLRNVSGKVSEMLQVTPDFISEQLHHKKNGII